MGRKRTEVTAQRLEVASEVPDVPVLLHCLVGAAPEEDANW